MKDRGHSSSSVRSMSSHNRDTVAPGSMGSSIVPSAVEWRYIFYVCNQRWLLLVFSYIRPRDYENDLTLQKGWTSRLKLLVSRFVPVLAMLAAAFTGVVTVNAPADAAESASATAPVSLGQKDRGIFGLN